MSYRLTLASILATSFVLTSMVGCGSPAPPAMPPTEVSVITLSPETVEQVQEFAGQVEASRSVQVRAQVEGVILERPFREGTSVQAGEVLYRLDPRSYDAAWRSAQGRLAEAEARLANAEQNLARASALITDNAIARREFDAAEAEAKQARAGLDAARGALDRARKDLDDTVVRAELAGRVGRTSLEVGARVRGPEDVLTTIDVLDPVYVSFRPPVQQLLDWRRDPARSRRLAPGGGLVLEAVLPDGSIAPRTGRLDFVDPVLDPATGTQRFRAVFDNRDRLLVPGSFVRVRLRGLTRDSVLVVPQRAVFQQMGRLLVYVVGPGDTVQVRNVETAGWAGERWVIAGGLAGGDRVIVDGIQKVGPGAVVRPVSAADSAARVPPGDSASGRGGGA